MSEITIEKRIVGQFFWVRTPTALVSKNSITPEDYNNVESIEGEFSDGSRFSTEVTNIN